VEAPEGEIMLDTPVIFVMDAEIVTQK